MMKRLFVCFAGVLLVFSAFGEAKDAPAIVQRTDGRAWRVSLQSVDADQLLVKMENSSVSRSFKLAEVSRLEFMGGTYNSTNVLNQFNAADYVAVIGALGPAMIPYADYAFFPNNREKEFLLLMKALYMNGNFDQAAALALRLSGNPDPVMQSSAKAYQALAVLGSGDATAAEELRQKLTDPAAKLYIQACMEHASGRPVDAIQTAVNLIADHGNDMNWMPQTELLCAVLYKEMGMTNSSAAVARQARKFYEGTNIGAEAQKLQAELE